MKLYRKLISGNDFISEEVSGIFEYVAGDNLDILLYEDISGIVSWHTWGVLVGFDYKRWRDEIKNIVSTMGSGSVDAGFALCTSEEKDILCYHKIGSQSLRTAHTSFAEMEASGNAYNVRATEVRRERYRRAEGMIRNYLPNDSNSLFASEGATISDVGNAYMDYGVEGTPTDGIPGIYDWLYGSLATKNYIPEQGYTCQTLAAKIWDCIHSGIY